MSTVNICPFVCMHMCIPHFCLHALYGADIRGDYKPIPYALNKSTPLPLLHPEAANDVSAKNHRTMPKMTPSKLMSTGESFFGIQ